MDSTPSRRLPLEGLRVVEFTHMVMGPTCGMMLADMGAEVIKVEPVEGDRTRHLLGAGAGFFPLFNRNKKSIAIDLRKPEGAEVARKLAASADVVAENFRPGTMGKFGLDYASLSPLNPRLIYVSHKGFLPGPYEHRTALDEVVQMMGGLAYMTGRPGDPLRAGGLVGTAAMIKSAPDGQTLSVVSNNHVIYPSVLKSLPFDPIADITPISVIGTTPMVLVVNPAKVPATNVKELVAFLKAKPGVYNYASSGNGTILHLAAQMFVDEAKVDVKHIPYKGVGPMVADLIGGQVEMGVLSLPSIQGHLKSGALRAIGVGGQTRSAAAPDIPTIAEQGLPNYQVEGWFAVIGPARLPAAEVARIHAAVTAAFATPEVSEAMARQGNSINPSSPEAAAQFFRSELAKYARLVKAAGVEAQ